MTDTAEDVDGRRLRRAQNREAVLDALAALFRQGVYQPSTNQIAERAGLSPRSLFRYFDDVDDLNRAVIERQLDRARPLAEVDVGPEAPLPAKIDHLVAARARLFDAIAPEARAGRMCAHRHAVVAAQIRDSRSQLRQQIRLLFAPELGGERAGLLPALDTLCSFESYELLRYDQGLSREKAISTLAAALSALLEPAAGSR